MGLSAAFGMGSSIASARGAVKTNRRKDNQKRECCASAFSGLGIAEMLPKQST